MENIIFIGGSFVIVVVLFVFALFKFVLSNKPKEREYEIDIQNSFGIETVMMVLDSQQSTLEDLQNAIDKLFEDYDRLTPDKQQVKRILLALCMHKNAEKNIILETQKKFQDKQPELAQDLEKTVKKGIDGRGRSFR